MNRTELQRYETILQDMAKDLREQNLLAQESQSVVKLDQQSVGRLSRMDAIQQQAMANATQSR